MAFYYWHSKHCLDSKPSLQLVHILIYNTPYIPCIKHLFFFNKGLFSTWTWYSLQSEIKQMFQDMMSQLGSLSSVLTKCMTGHLMPPVKKLGISRQMTSQVKRWVNDQKRQIWGVNPSLKCLSQHRCFADNKTKQSWTERFSAQEGDETRDPKLDSETLERIQPETSILVPKDSNGCFEIGLGSSLSRHSDRWPVDL